MNERVACDIAAGVADVRLARADKMNALDEAMFLGLLEVGERLNKEVALRAVVLSGEGRAFCAGLDMASFAGMAGAGADRQQDRLGLRTLKARTHGLANSVQQVAWQWRELPVPVIAAVHGVAYGGGFQIALGADLRYAAPGTKLSIMEMKWGLVPDMAGTQLMRHLAREDVVRELTYTGRVFSAEEALGYGFVTRLADDPRAAALETAREIAGKSPHAIRAAKRLLNLAATSEPAAGLVAESVEQQALIGTPNQLEAVMANLGKREARFADV
jgi:enoyl-CoA hydratase/carnithine racemase